MLRLLNQRVFCCFALQSSEPAQTTFLIRSTCVNGHSRLTDQMWLNTVGHVVLHAYFGKHAPITTEAANMSSTHAEM